MEATAGPREMLTDKTDKIEVAETRQKDIA